LIGLKRIVDSIPIYIYRVWEYSHINCTLIKHDIRVLKSNILKENSASQLFKPKSLKGVVHFLKKTVAEFTHPHVIQDVHVFLSSVKKKLRF